MTMAEGVPTLPFNCVAVTRGVFVDKETDGIPLGDDVPPFTAPGFCLKLRTVALRKISENKKLQYFFDQATTNLQIQSNI